MIAVIHARKSSECHDGDEEGEPMQSFQDIQKNELANLTGEIGTLGRRLVELGWSREQVVAYVKQLLTDPTKLASGDPTASHTEDRP